jgi:hypothetical protein
MMMLLYENCNLQARILLKFEEAAKLTSLPEESPHSGSDSHSVNSRPKFQYGVQTLAARCV